MEEWDDGFRADQDARGTGRVTGQAVVNVIVPVMVDWTFNVIVPTGDSDKSFLAAFQQTLDRQSRVRLVFLSHVSCQDGRRLPIERAIQIAHARSIPLAIDAAQAAGQFAINVTALGCDYYVGSGHKWLLSPPGLAYVFARRPELFSPAAMMAPSAVLSPGVDGKIRPAPMARRIEIGIENWAILAGLDAGLTLLDEIGMDAIEAYVQRLTSRLRSGLSAIPGVSLLAPTVERATGIVTFSLAGQRDDGLRTLAAALWRDAKVFVKVQPEHPAIRVSIAAFNSVQDVDRLLSALTPMVNVDRSPAHSGAC